MAFDVNAAKKAGYSDAEIVDFLAPQKKFDVNAAKESGYDNSEILSFLTTNDKPAAKEGVLRQAADIPVNFAKGITQGVRMLSDAFGANNAVSSSLRGVEDYLGNLLSAQAKNDQQEIAKILKDAEDKGVLEQVQAGLKAFTVAPIDLISQAFGTVIPTLAGGLAGQALKIGARTAAVGTGATMGAGVGKGSIYDAVKEELTNAKIPPDQVELAATQAQEYGGKNLDLILANTLLGGVAAGTGVERALLPGFVRNINTNLAKKGVFGRAAATGAPELLTEAGQGGTEQFSQNVALQREGFDVPTFRGVASAATLEGLAGGALGAGVGAFSRAPEQAPAATPPSTAPTREEAELFKRAEQASYQPLSAEEARQQDYQRQIDRQNAFQAGLVEPERVSTAQPPVSAPPVDLAAAAQQNEQAIQQQMAAQDARQQPSPTAQPLFTPAPRQEFPAAFADLAAAQQSIDGTRFQQQTPAPSITPAQAVMPTAGAVASPQMQAGFDRQAQLLGQAQGLPQVERVGLEAQADIAGGTGQVAVPQTRFVDLTPMSPREARQKLAVLQEESPESALNIVPHPEMSGRFAIEERVTPAEEAPEPLRPSPKGMTEQEAVAALRQVEATGAITPEAIAASQQYGLNIDPMLMQFAERTTPENLLVQQRRGMADEAALEAELRGGIATPEEAQRLRETGMGRPYDSIVAPRSEATAELGKGERQRRLEAEAIAEQDAKKAEFFQTLQGPELWLDGFELGINPKSAIQTASPQFKEQFMKPEGRYSLVTTATSETKATVADLRKKLLPMLRRFGLGDVGLRLVDSIENGTADGMYAQQVITLALDSDNPMGVMRHEVIHALKELGAFTKAEWKVLTDAAQKTWINQFFNRDIQDRYQRVYLEQNGNLEGFPEYLQEEAIAQAFRFFSETKPPSGMIANLMRRLNNFFEAIRNFFQGKGFQNIDEMFLPNRILADIERGAITPGRADVRPTTAPKFNLRFEQSGDLTPLDVQKVRVYEKELDALTKKIGSRIAGMTSDQTVDDVRKAIKKLQSYTAQGLEGREWYERSAKAILDAFNGDPVLAEKLFQIIAITSANTEVAANFTKATNAWRQFASGKPIKVGTGDTNKKIEALLYFGIDWDGRKTNTFYTNLMEAMDGKDSGRSTIDLHMTRMIFGKDTPTDAQYELAENMVRLMASKLNIPPRQVQAASWVTQKAKGMFEDYRARGRKSELNDEQLRQLAFERAITDYSHLMKAKVKQLPITQELSEPSPDIRARTQTITGEVIPSVKTEMSQMEELDFASKEKLTKEVQKGNFVPDIAKTLGIDSRIRVTVESGAYEGKVNPNLKVQVINADPAVAESDARDLAYAMSYVFKQDATPFFRADPRLLNQDQYGVSLKFGKALTPSMQKKIFGVMSQYLGADVGFSKVGPNEIVMINYRGEDGQPFLMPDPEFIDALANAREEINQLSPIEDVKAFGAKSEYPYHDWQADTGGNAILERLQDSRGERPYLQKRLNNLRESFVGKARDAVVGAEATPRFSLRDFGSDQSALRPSPSSDAGINFNPIQEDAVAYQGSHYGKAKTEALNGSMYGSGLRGTEARRLEQSYDDRIRRRVYFYIPRSNDTMPNREGGVGGFVYTQKLSNILPPGQTMARLAREAAGDGNAFESLVLDNGYDGYAVPDDGMMVVLNQDVPVKYEGTVDEVHGGKKFSLRAPTTPEFKRFFKDSKVVDKDGKPLVVYHGTNQEINEFTTQPSALRSKFYAGEIGSWFGDDPKVANNFAKGVSSPRQGGSVYPVFLNIKNPKVYESYESFLSDAKGRRSAPAMRKELIKQGFDGIQIKDSDTDFGGRRDDFVAFYPNQIKSAFNQRPTESPDIRYSLRAPKTPEFKEFFGKSKVVNPDGTPKVMYHGTARDIFEFIPKQANAIFVTESPEFAEIFTNESAQYMVQEQIKSIQAMFQDMSPQDQLELMRNGYKLAVKEKFLSKAAVKDEIAELTDMVNQGLSLTNEFGRVAESFAPSIERSLTSGRNIMPLYVRAENPFDYQNPRHIARLRESFGNDESVMEGLISGDWNTIESEDVQAVIKDEGFDGFYVKERGKKNLAVYNPAQLKSATGNRGTFDPNNPDIRYSLTNEPPNRYTKLVADDPTTGQAIVDTATSAFNAVRSDSSRTSARIKLVDKYAGLSRALESLPLFSDGTLRADMLHHSKAQGINLIKTGLVTGTPYLNDDGTIAIERSENNLARSAYLADRLNSNPNVVASGLSGRAYVAETARMLRGADILAEDAEIRAEGERQLAQADARAKKLVKEAKGMSPRAIAEEQKEIDDLRKEGNKNIKIKRELQVKPEDIAWAKKQLEITPELQDILGIWKEVNTSLVDLYEAVGLIDKETADKYRSQKNYVPLFKSREDLNEEQFFRAGSGTKSVAKIKKLEGADITRNIWENVDKQYAIMIAAAYENQTRKISVEQMRGISPDLAEITNASDPRVNLRYRDDGKDVHVVIENPNDLAAFQSMTHQLSPTMKFLGGFTQVLRAGALINPMFWIRQLIRDPIHATLTAQAGVVTPFHSAKEFMSIITRNSDEARILAERGVIGQFDSTISLDEFLGNVGKDKQKSPNFIQKGLHKLLEIHEASDAATRVAIFKKAKAQAIKDGMSEKQAVDYAVFKARESINFALTGDSSFLAAARQMIPFLNATIVGLDTLYRAATGYGLNAEEKAKAKKMFRQRAMMLVGMTLAYATLMQDDEEYKKLPDYVKDGNWLFPIWLPETGKTFVKIPVPYEVGYLFKTLPEVLVRYLSDTSTGKEALASIGTGFIHNMPTGGTPIPQFAKPTLEVVSNYSFFTGRPIEGMSDSRLPVAQRGQKASEFSKMLSNLGLDNIGLSPAKLDVFIKGTFAEAGTMATELADALIMVASGETKTPKNLVNQPFMRSFLTDPQVNKAVSDYYEISRTATETANLFTKYKQEGRGEELRALVEDQDKRQQIAAAPVLRKIGQGMSQIQKAIRAIDANKALPPEERRARINELQQRYGELAEQGREMAETLNLR